MKMLTQLILVICVACVLLGGSIVHAADPSLMPTTNPTTIPTNAPSAKPTKAPSAKPTKAPTADPTVSPTTDPTIDPTVSPTLAPSPDPTADPTPSPTADPSIVPSAIPSWVPTCSPSTIPTIAPTTKPTKSPTKRPTHAPTPEPSVSMYPTAMPSSTAVPRYILCDSLYCEGGGDTDCYYTTKDVFLQCIDEYTPCEIDTGMFVVGPNTRLTVTGGCELVVTAKQKATINRNTTVKASAISITAKGSDIVIYGTVTTSGLGPLDGPGAPTGVDEVGYGGSYGGSGGQPTCGNKYFSNVNAQIGSINVLSDVDPSSSNYNATYGSGGGFPGAGFGGGRIVLKATGTVIIHPEGQLLADGSRADDPTMGAGSGGSVTVSAAQCAQNGFISARGGWAHEFVVDAGAAGGGGRVAIVVSSLNSTNEQFSTRNVNISVAGGRHLTDACRSGASGTAYVQLGHGGFHLFNAALWLDNHHIKSYAVTAIDYIPSLTNLLSIADGAVASSTHDLHLQSLSTCGTSVERTVDCSIITIVNASFVALSNDTESNLHNDGANWGISADQVNLFHAHLSGSANTFYSFNITAGSVEISENSTVWYSGGFHVQSSVYAHLVGEIIQVPGRIASTVEDSYYHRSSLTYTVGKNVTIGNIVASNMRIRADTVIVLASKTINSPAGFIPQACQVNVNLNAFTCKQNRYIGSLRYNNTYVVVGQTAINVHHGALLEAAQVLLCAPNIYIARGAAVSANQRGCVASHGLGAGGPQSASDSSVMYGAGGGGYGGQGGNGYNAENGGGTYASSGLSSGSGGGCYHCNRTYLGAGGGIINIVANSTMVLNGNLTSNGGYGSEDAGGGSGGTVTINSLSMSGKGYISVSGGSGGSGKYPGGGGGGGVLTIFNTQNYYLSYSYVGVVSASGGQPGHPLLTDPDFYSSEWSQGRRTLRAGDRNRAAGKVLLENTDDYSGYDPTPSEAMRGEDGVLNLPKCPPGYGNSVDSGTVCGLCPIGTYAPGDGKNDCYYCDNKPSHSTYTTAGWTTSDCPYQCNTGYSTSDCYTPFQNFIFHTLGTVGLAFCAVGIFTCVLSPMVYYRYKKEYGWFEENKAISPTDAFTHVDDFRTLERRRRSSADVVGSPKQFSVDNPMLAAHAGPASEVSADQSKASSGGDVASYGTGISLPKAIQRVNRDLRLRYRLVDPDLVNHACRINLLGSNHPYEARGGAWRLPLSRPACLRPMLRKDEYREFAEKVNKRLAWKPFGWEMILFYTVAFLVPPLAALLMRQYRKRRGNRLLKIIASYDYACFRCPRARLNRNSIRVGISPDATLAYLDFLYDEERSLPRTKPLCPIGQVRLPASFKLAGLGTYSSPFFIDTNDLILQAVPQTDIPSSFINAAWISFVVELNTVLRTVHKDSLYFGIRRLIRFLSQEQHVVDLGGLVIEFCTFSNVDVPYASEADASSHSAAVLDKRVSTAHTRSSRSATQTTDHRNTSWERWIMKQRASERSSAGPGPSPQTSDLERSGSNAVQRSVDLAFTSPQVSVDARPSLIETTTKTAYSCAGCVLGCLAFVVQFFLTLWWHWEDSLNPTEDPVGATLSFLEMCEAIRQGRLKMGIVVTHPKVAMQTYQVQDEDYESDDDSYYTDEGREQSSASVDSASIQSLPHIAPLATATTDAKPPRPQTTKINSALRRTYGDKAEEVAKFYNIMVAADSSMAAANKDAPGAGAASAAGTPVMPAYLSAMMSQKQASAPEKTPTTTQSPPRKPRGSITGAADGVGAAPPQEYTDLSPFRSMRRLSKGPDRDSIAMNPRLTDMSTEGRITDEEISRFQSFRGDDDDAHSSRDSRGSDGSEQDEPAGVGAEQAGSAAASALSSASGRGSALVSQNAPVMLDRKSIAAREMKRRSAPRLRKDLTQENLAASAYQHPVNVWRLTANQEFVSEGMLQLERSILTNSGRSVSDNSAASSVVTHSSVDDVRDTEERLRLASVAVRIGDSRSPAVSAAAAAAATPTTFSATVGSPPATRVRRGSKPPPPSPWYDIRSFLGATSSSKTRMNTSAHSMTVSEEPTPGRSVSSGASDVASDMGSNVVNDYDSNSERSGQKSQDLEAANAADQLADAQRESTQQRVSQRRKSTKPVFNLGGYRPFYFLRLMVFYFRNVMLGSNVYPLGPKYVRKVLELLIFVLCIVDFAVSIIVLTSAYCASRDTTACQDHTSMILMLAVWPGALFIAPLMGLVTVVLGPSGMLARMYAMWSRIACINSAMVLLSLFYFFSYYYNVPGSIYGMLVLPSSRFFQCLIVDQYIAHIERLRYTRGWDGLHTSLYKTQDNLQEVTI